MKYRKPSTRAKSVDFRTFAIVILLAVPLLAGARGIFSDNDQGARDRGIVLGATYNLQTLALLDPKGSSVSFSQGGGDVEILDVSALKSTQGPSDGGGEKIANTKSGNISLYTVREGDSVGLIAQMFGVSVNTVIWANDIKNSTIKPGDSLVILPMSGVRHRVKAGDTVASIARAYSADAVEILSFNGMSLGETLTVGGFINIPDGEVEQVVSKPQVKSASSSSLIRPIVGGVKTQGIHGYNAVDLAAPVGTPIIAAASGTVMTAKADGGWNGGYGNYVIIKHSDGVQTLSAHFGEVLVGSGQTVVQGQTLGYIGMTGKTTGPHIHFEVRGAVNPF